MNGVDGLHVNEIGKVKNVNLMKLGTDRIWLNSVAKLAMLGLLSEE